MTLVAIELNKQTHKEVAGSNPVVSISSKTFLPPFSKNKCSYEYLFFLQPTSRTPRFVPKRFAQAEA